MPEFVMEGRDEAARELDPFVYGYVEALFFTETAPQVDRREFVTKAHKRRMEEGTAGGSLPCDVGPLDLYKATLAKVKADCAKFQADNAAALAEAYQVAGYDEAAAGRDFWFTRNGHGVGYWDRDLGDLGDTLADAARGWRECYPYYQRGKVGLD